jgi:hypothetical protein
MLQYLPWLWCLTPLSTIFHLYIVEVIFIGRGNWSAWRKPPTCRKSLTNLSQQTAYYRTYIIIYYDANSTFWSGEVGELVSHLLFYITWMVELSHSFMRWVRRDHDQLSRYKIKFILLINKHNLICQNTVWTWHSLLYFVFNILIWAEHQYVK